MKCLEDIIGLKNLCDDKNYKCYTDIPLKLWAKLATEEDKTGRALFMRLRERAAELVSDEFMDCLPYSINSIIETKLDGVFSDEYVCFGKTIGRRIKKNCKDQYIQPHVVSFTVSVKNATDSFKYFIKDKCGVKDFCIPLVCGENTIDVSLEGDCIDIYFEEQGLEFYAADDKSCSCISTCSCCFKIEDICIEGGQVISSDVTPFQLCVNCVCTEEKFVCKYKSLLKEPMRMRLESLFWEEFEGSCRKNETKRGLEEDAGIKLAKILGGNNPKTGDKISRKISKYWPKLWSAARKAKITIGESKCTSCRRMTYVEQI